MNNSGVDIHQTYLNSSEYIQLCSMFPDIPPNRIENTYMRNDYIFDKTMDYLLTHGDEEETPPSYTDFLQSYEEEGKRISLNIPSHILTADDKSVTSYYPNVPAHVLSEVFRIVGEDLNLFHQVLELSLNDTGYVDDEYLAYSVASSVKNTADDNSSPFVVDEYSHNFTSTQDQDDYDNYNHSDSDDSNGETDLTHFLSVDEIAYQISVFERWQEADESVKNLLEKEKALKETRAHTKRDKHHKLKLTNGHRSNNDSNSRNGRRDCMTILGNSNKIGNAWQTGVTSGPVVGASLTSQLQIDGLCEKFKLPREVIGDIYHQTGCRSDRASQLIIDTYGRDIVNDIVDDIVIDHNTRQKRGNGNNNHGTGNKLIRTNERVHNDRNSNDDDNNDDDNDEQQKLNSLMQQVLSLKPMKETQDILNFRPASQYMSASTITDNRTNPRILEACLWTFIFGKPRYECLSKSKNHSNGDEEDMEVDPHMFEVKPDQVRHALNECKQKKHINQAMLNKVGHRKGVSLIDSINDANTNLFFLESWLTIAAFNEANSKHDRAFNGSSSNNHQDRSIIKSGFIDLHCQSVQSALVVLGFFLMFFSQRLQLIRALGTRQYVQRMYPGHCDLFPEIKIPQYLTVIVGKGNHSREGKQQLYPSVMNMIREKGYKVAPNSLRNSPIIKIYVDKNSKDGIFVPNTYSQMNSK